MIESVGPSVSKLQYARSGFTIVELLIVIVVIGILAAIVIVAYNGVQNRAYDTTVQSDMVAMAKKIELQAVTTSGTYSGLTVATGIKITKSAYDTAENNLYYCINPYTNKYALSARSRTKKDYKVINGVLSEHSSKLYGASTCDLVRTSPGETLNADLGWNAAGPTWSPWAQG